MKFRDPQSLVCPSCSRVQTAAVEALLQLRARCECGGGFEAVGRDLRARADREDALLVLFRVAEAAEEALGICVPELDFEDTFTLRDILNALRPFGRGKDVKSAIEGAVRSTEPEAPPRLEWDIPILDAVRPRRWDVPPA